MSGRRSLAGLLGVGPAALLLVGCVEVGAFACASDQQCDGANGARCFEGGCAILDDTCPGGYRFGGDARPTQKGTCVNSSGGASSSTSSPETEGGSTLGPPTSSTTTNVGSSTQTSVGSSDSSTSASTDASSSTGCGPLGCTCTEALAVGQQYNCLLRAENDVVCWGRNNNGQAGVLGEGLDQVNDPAVVELPPGTTEVAVHYEHTCALGSDGTVSCWGRNFAGAVDPTAMEEGQVGPVVVAGVEDAVALRLAYRSSCARLSDDRVACWGSNGFEQLLTEASGPGPHITGPYLEGLVDLQLGQHHGCMWNDVEVACWGRNHIGQLAAPIGDSAVPLSIDLPLAPAHVAVGNNHACAALVDGSVYCWGDNTYNQISGEKTPRYLVPTLLDTPWLGSIVQLIAQSRTTCARTDDAELWCWGNNFGGYLGIDGALNSESVWPPQRIDAMDELADPVLEVGLGLQHMCARLDSNEVHCWGNTNVGQIGPSLPANGMDSVEIHPCGA